MELGTPPGTVVSTRTVRPSARRNHEPPDFPPRDWEVPVYLAPIQEGRQRIKYRKRVYGVLAVCVERDSVVGGMVDVLVLAHLDRGAWFEVRAGLS